MVLPTDIDMKRDLAMGDKSIDSAPRTSVCVMTVSMMNPALEVASSAM